MNNKNVKIVICIISVFLFLALVISFLGIGYANKIYTTNQYSLKMHKDFVLIEEKYDDIIVPDNTVFTNYDEYHNLFYFSYVLTRDDFKKNNYVLIKIPYNSCSEDDITPTDYKMDGNRILVTVKYTSSCGVCAVSNIYYLLKVDKSFTNVEVEFDYRAINHPHCNPGISYKPLIYLYPETETDVTVKLGYPELLTYSYPQYDDSWKVRVKPNGDIIDASGRVYYGLYWEGYNDIRDDFEDGFVVSKDHISQFLEEKLDYLGLTEREANEFIIYWLPKLSQSDYTLIRFETLDKINEQMPLSVDPKPDTVIRVFMEYKPLDSKISIKEQNLISSSRKGFTVVEWGGSLIR